MRRQRSRLKDRRNALRLFEEHGLADSSPAPARDILNKTQRSLVEWFGRTFGSNDAGRI